MQVRINGEARERLRQLLGHQARRLGLTPTLVDMLVQSATLERWSGAERIRVADDGGERLAFLVTGALRVVCRAPQEKTVGVCFVAPGHVVPGTWPASERRRLEVIVHDRLGATVAVWGTRLLTDLFATLSTTNAVHLVTLAGQAALRLVEEKCELLALSLRDRVLAVLVTLARDFGAVHPDGVRIEVRVTHRDLGAAAMGSRANVTRALEELRAHDLVAVDDHRLVVTHRALALGRDTATGERPPERQAV